MERAHRTVLALVACLALAACATFSGGKTAAPQSWPPPSPRAKEPIVVEVTGTFADVRRPDSDLVRRDLTAEAVGVFRDSGQFSTVTSTPAAAALKATLHVDYEQTRTALFSVALFTLHLIPVPGFEGTVKVDAAFSRNGRVLCHVQREETWSVWMHLVLVFAAPFMSEEAVFRHVIRSTLDEAARRGWS